MKTRAAKMERTLYIFKYSIQVNYLSVIILLLPVTCLSQGFQKIEAYSFSHCIITEAGIRGEPKISVSEWTIGKFKGGELGWINRTPGNKNEVFAIMDYEESGDEVLYNCRYIFESGKTVPVKIKLYQMDEKSRLILEIRKTRYEYLNN